jgi:peroxiredoxin Q/BCP
MPSTSGELLVGQKAPLFTLKSDSGEKISLKDFKGRKVVLYFYPKDNTPGCTKEACSFRDKINLIKKRGAVVIGISADSVESHKKFKEKYNLNFPLLSDEKRRVIEKYGVWKEKRLYGRKTMGVERTTFIIDENGRIAHIFRKVKVDGHVDEVIKKLDELK